MGVLAERIKMLSGVRTVGVSGRVSGVRGLTVSVTDLPAQIGAGCRIGRGQSRVEGRVIGFAGEQTLVMPLGQMTGIARGDRVELTGIEQSVAVGPNMLGRVLDGTGRPIDAAGPIRREARMPLWPAPLDPMRRRRIDQPLSTGIRAIDALLTIGQGQRMGIFSGSGVGKSVLLGMISRYTAADVSVIALIGERGREVRDFIDRDLGPQGLKRAVVVVSTGDEPPLLRVQAGAVATAIAEYFRDQGANVLLLMDSLTRLATAQRQIGLAAGEPPASKGYTPSVFAMLPELLERSGRTESGSITGFYSVLVEGDDMAEPISDTVRSITDGHIKLSRTLAQRGQYPAIEVLSSVSRVMKDVSGQRHQALARRICRLMSQYDQVEDLLTVGAYQSGSGGEFDEAVAAMPAIRRLLCQRIEERCDLETAMEQLEELAAGLDAESAHAPAEVEP